MYENDTKPHYCLHRKDNAFNAFPVFYVDRSSKGYELLRVDVVNIHDHERPFVAASLRAMADLIERKQ